MLRVPEAIRAGARSRVKSTKSERVRVTKEVKKGRPLDAEDDEGRKVAFIAQQLQTSRSIARKVAAYATPESLPLTPSQKSMAESIQGKTVDFVPIRFLDMGFVASRAVARVAHRNREPVGTAFLVAPGVVLTNQHVAPSKSDADDLVLEFNYEQGPALSTLPVTRFALRPNVLYLADPEDDLDFALIAVGERIDGSRDLEQFGFLPLLDTPDKHIKGMFVNVIQHPEGRLKELVVRENRILARTKTTLIYGTDTLPGSSGSPVFNDNWEVLALHHYGSPFRAVKDGDGAFPDAGNEGIRISSIVKHLKAERDSLSGPRRKLLDAVLNPPSRQPVSENLPPPRNDTMSTPLFAQSLSSNDGLSITLPLTISVRLGGTTAVSGDPAPDKDSNVDETDDEVDRIDRELVQDKKYSNRRGYNRSFLGIPVELPQLTSEQKEVAARNQKSGDNDDPYELKYQHFSVVMNAKRRLAFFTAVNIDGASVVNINRKTGKVTRIESEEGESAEAYEKWFDDPRVKPDERSDQSLYSNAKLKKFQRGHLVKRTDPSWGTAARAIKGQSDTFHFTNCCPQHQGFNPNTSRWAGIENWLTKQSDDEDLRITVFCGPVLDDDDPKLSYIRVPKQFWKVVVWAEEGELKALGMLADQSDLLPGGEAVDAEDLSDVPDALKEFQCSIAKIEELTELSFGDLSNADVFPGSDGEAVSKMRRIRDFDDLVIRGDG